VTTDELHQLGGMLRACGVDTAEASPELARQVGVDAPAAPPGAPGDHPPEHRRVDRRVAGRGALSAVSDATAIAATAIGAAASGAAGLPPGLDPALRAVLPTIAAGTPGSHRLVAAAGRAQAQRPLESLPRASFAPPGRRGGRVMLTATRRSGVALTLPADFHEVPLDQDLEQRVAAQSRLLDRLLAAGGRRELLALVLEAMARHLGSAGIAGAACCAVRIGEHASTATLTVGFHETATTDRTLALLGAAAMLRGSVGAVETTAYAGHPALTWALERPLADGIVIREVQVLVPSPDVPVGVLVSLATPMPQDWGVYQQVMHAVCTSLRFDPAVSPRGAAAGRVLRLPAGRRPLPLP
jgi:hypothetical protein